MDIHEAVLQVERMCKYSKDFTALEAIRAYIRESTNSSHNTASTPCQFHEWLRLGKAHTGFVWCPYCREAL